MESLPDDLRNLVADAGVDELPQVRTAVVVGNRFAAGEVHEKPDGTRVHTIWGEIAWQLAGKDGYALLADSDRNGTNPGERIRDVLALASPCLVLIDEWVAYAREALRHRESARRQLRQPVRVRPGIDRSSQGHSGCLVRDVDPGFGGHRRFR